MAKKLIPCRVCGKMFEPCSYCQQHKDVFRWRNFACSIECAKQYIADAEAYRASLHAQNDIEAKSVKNTNKKKTKKTKEATVATGGATVANDDAIVGSETVVELSKDTGNEVETTVATDMVIEDI